MELDGDDGHEQVDEEEGDDDDAGDKEQLGVEIEGLADSVHDVGPPFVGGDLENVDVAVAEGVERNLVPVDIRVLLPANAIRGTIRPSRAVVPAIVLIVSDHIKPAPY